MHQGGDSARRASEKEEGVEVIVKRCIYSLVFCTPLLLYVHSTTLLAWPTTMIVETARTNTNALVEITFHMKHRPNKTTKKVVPSVRHSPTARAKKRRSPAANTRSHNSNRLPEIPPRSPSIVYSTSSLHRPRSPLQSHSPLRYPPPTPPPSA